MTYLLDTDILSQLMRRQPPMALLERLSTVPAAEQCTTSINYGELVYGAERKPDLRAELNERIERLLRPNLTILPFDAGAAGRYGMLRAHLESSGNPIGDADTRIAAIALHHHLTVVTANQRRFERVPDLAVQNWLES